MVTTRVLDLENALTFKYTRNTQSEMVNKQAMCQSGACKESVVFPRSRTDGPRFIPVNPLQRSMGITQVQSMQIIPSADWTRRLLTCSFILTELCSLTSSSSCWVEHDLLNRCKTQLYLYPISSVKQFGFRSDCFRHQSLDGRTRQRIRLLSVRSRVARFAEI